MLGVGPTGREATVFSPPGPCQEACGIGTHRWRSGAGSCRSTPQPLRGLWARGDFGVGLGTSAIPPEPACVLACCHQAPAAGSFLLCPSVQDVQGPQPRLASGASACTSPRRPSAVPGASVFLPITQRRLKAPCKGFSKDMLTLRGWHRSRASPSRRRPLALCPHRHRAEAGGLAAPLRAPLPSQWSRPGLGCHATSLPTKGRTSCSAWMGGHEAPQGQDPKQSPGQ